MSGRTIFIARIALKIIKIAIPTWNLQCTQINIITAQRISPQLLQILTKRQKYARKANIRCLYRAKDILKRFPYMKSIMYTNKHNKSTNNQSTITKNVDGNTKYARTDYILRSYRAKNIINRFPIMKYIMCTNKPNTSINN